MNEMFRVTHVIGGGEFGGAEKHILQLLRELKNMGIIPHVICFYDSLFAEKLREEKIDVDVLQYNRFDLKLYFGLVKVLQEKKPTIVHTHGVKANFFGRLAAKKVEIPTVVTTVHSLIKYDYDSLFVRFVVKIMEKITRNKTDHFIAISEAIKNELINLGIDENKINVIRHGIDTTIFSPKEDSAADKLAKEWGKGKDQFLIGAIGRLKDVKGFSYYIEACALLHKKDPEKYKFVLIGEGPEKESLAHLVKEKNLEDHFLFAGFRSDIPSCLRALDCYVSSSLSEGLGLSVMEAMASGLPVVVTGVGGIVDFTRDQHNALLVKEKSGEDIALAVEKIAGDEVLAARLSKNAVTDIQNDFSINRMAEETYESYKMWHKK